MSQRSPWFEGPRYLAAFGPQPVRINDPGCVSKTFPGFFEAWRSIVR